MVGNVLGQGGFGITYAGKDTTLDIRIAIKEYYPAGHASRDSLSSNDVTLLTGPNESYFANGKGFDSSNSSSSSSLACLLCFFRLRF